MKLTLRELIHPGISFLRDQYLCISIFGNFGVYRHICENLSASNLLYLHMGGVIPFVMKNFELFENSLLHYITIE